MLPSRLSPISLTPDSTPVGYHVQGHWSGSPEGESGCLETGDFSFISHHIHKEGEVAARGEEGRGWFPYAGNGSVMTKSRS